MIPVLPPLSPRPTGEDLDKFAGFGWFLIRVMVASGLVGGLVAGGVLELVHTFTR